MAISSRQPLGDEEKVLREKPTAEKHPLTIVRESLGLTGIGLARLAGIRYQRVLVIEMGLSESLGWKISRALREQGVDVDRLKVEIMRWRLDRSVKQGGMF